MNNIFKKATALIFVSAAAITSMAQESSTGYFMENYNMRWQMNPAMGNRYGYVGFPGLGNMNVSVNGNLSPTDIFYARDGKTLIFTNPLISTSEAMGKFGNVNRLSENLKLGVIQVGFKAFGGYNNIAINVKENISADLPKSIFSLAKEGISNQTYDIKDLRVNAKAYAEIALNHSRDIKQVKGLRVGGSIKFLLPVAFAEANFNELALDLGEDNWRVRSNAEMKIGLKGFKYETDENDRTHHEYVSGGNFDDAKYTPNGFGFGVDLGAIYKWREFSFSLGLTDLGMLGFSSVSLASTGGTKTFDTDSHPIGVGDDSEGWNNFTDDLAKLYELDDKGTVSSNVALDGKLRLGVDYEFPFYKKLHFGFMNTTTLSSIFPMTEFRLSANVEPIKGIAVSASAATGTYSTNCGFLLSLGNKGFNFLLGLDYAFFKMDKNYYPLTSNCDVHLGINFPF